MRRQAQLERQRRLGAESPRHTTRRTLLRASFPKSALCTTQAALRQSLSGWPGSYNAVAPTTVRNSSRLVVIRCYLPRAISKELCQLQTQGYRFR